MQCSPYRTWWWHLGPCKSNKKRRRYIIFCRHHKSAPLPLPTSHSTSSHISKRRKNETCIKANHRSSNPCVSSPGHKISSSRSQNYPIQQARVHLPYSELLYAADQVWHDHSAHRRACGARPAHRALVQARAHALVRSSDERACGGRAKMEASNGKNGTGERGAGMDPGPWTWRSAWWGTTAPARRERRAPATCSSSPASTLSRRRPPRPRRRAGPRRGPATRALGRHGLASSARNAAGGVRRPPPRPAAPAAGRGAGGEGASQPRRWWRPFCAGDKGRGPRGAGKSGRAVRS